MTTSLAPRPNKRSYTKQEIALAVRLRDEGYAMTYIGQRLGRTPAAVSNQLKIRGHRRKAECRFCHKQLPPPSPLTGGRTKMICEACQFALTHDLGRYEERHELKTCSVCQAEYSLVSRDTRYASGVPASMSEDCCSIKCSRKAWLAQTKADPERYARFQERQGRSTHRALVKTREARDLLRCGLCGAPLPPRAHAFCSKEHRLEFWSRPQDVGSRQYYRGHRAWTSEEDAEVTRMVLLGLTNQQISDALSRRTLPAVIQRVWRLGLSGKRSRPRRSTA